MSPKPAKLILLNSPSKKQRLLLLRFYNKNFAKSKWNKKYFEKYLSEKKFYPICIIIKSQNEIGGLIMGKMSCTDRSRLNLTSLVVSFPYRGQGWGDLLIINFFSLALGISSMKSIYLHFRESNKGLKNFYKRFGFKNYTICGKYSNGEKKYYMEISRKSIQKYLKEKDLCPN